MRGKELLAVQIEAIFERFRQVGDSLTAKPEGTGLGLPISREIVPQHRGVPRPVQLVTGRRPVDHRALPVVRIVPLLTAFRAFRRANCPASGQRESIAPS